MAQGLLPPSLSRTLVTSTLTTATTSNIALPVADCYTALINVTAVANTSPTIDIVFQASIDGGTTYVNLPLRSAQLTATGCYVMSFRRGLAIGEVGFNNAATADTGGTVNKDCTFDPRYVKIKYTLGGTGGGHAFSINIFAEPRSFVN